MPRIYLPLIPLPLLAAVVALSACSKERAEETTHVIPPAVAYAAATPTPAPTLPSPAPAATPAAEDAPSAEEVKEFERTVAK